MKTKYPRLYELEKKKSCKVSERKNEGGNMWNWRSCPIVAGCSSELERLVNDMDSIRLQPGVDQLSCLLSADGKYRVNLLRKKIDQGFTANVNHFQISWCKLIPIKVTTFIWRAVMGKIPSAVALSYRGVTLDTCNCSSFIGGIEYANHILVECPYANYQRLT
ncbi:unnamed protein product [Lactuca virosa]|uniref:Reverse transcriptase zinc-binding domain-containing protein n=1 Tax=Lactuca virosa TaxID=75947 RepID=A0AAU9PR67_9ASTR|nr:unnamed protein product [Lactuca virosa]